VPSFQLPLSHSLRKSLASFHFCSRFSYASARDIPSSNHISFQTIAVKSSIHLIQLQVRLGNMSRWLDFPKSSSVILKKSEIPRDISYFSGARTPQFPNNASMTSSLPNVLLDFHFPPVPLLVCHKYGELLLKGLKLDRARRPHYVEFRNGSLVFPIRVKASMIRRVSSFKESYI
jgi:hypothetical protein